LLVPLLFLLMCAVSGASHPTMMAIKGSVDGISDANLGVKISTSASCSTGVFFDHNYSAAVQDNDFNVLLGSQFDLNLNYNQDYYICLYVNSALVGNATQFRGGHGQIGIDDIGDLNANFVPYIGAKTDLNLGIYGLRGYGDANIGRLFSGAIYPLLGGENDIGSPGHAWNSLYLSNDIFGDADTSICWGSTRGLCDLGQITGFAGVTTTIQTSGDFLIYPEGGDITLNYDRFLSDLNGKAFNDASLVGLWKFNRDLNNSSVKDNPASGLNLEAADYSTDVLNVDGVNECAQVVDESDYRFTETQQFSFSAWVNAVNDSGHIMGKMRTAAQPNGTFGYQLWIDAATNYWVVFTIDQSGTGSYTLTTPVNSILSGEWYHVVATYNNKRMKIYLDGELKAAGVSTTSTSGSPQNELVIGCRHYDNTYAGYLAARIDDVRVYNRELSAREARSLFEQGIDRKFSHQEDVYADAIHFGYESTDVNIFYDTNFMFQYGSGAAWFSGGISADSYFTRTSVYDPARGSALSYVKDSTSYLTALGDINHAAFYGHAVHTFQDCRPVPVSVWCREIYNVVSEIECQYSRPLNLTGWTESTVLKTVCAEREEAVVNIDLEISLLRQAVYDLKTELCNYGSYSWC